MIAGEDRKVTGYLSDIKHLKEYGNAWILPFWWKIPEKKIQRFDKIYGRFLARARRHGEISPELREHFKDLYAMSLSESVDLNRFKSTLERLFVFLSMPKNRTSANCHVVDSFVTGYFRERVELPRRYVAVIIEIEALHGAVEEPENHVSPEDILEMIRQLPTYEDD